MTMQSTTGSFPILPLGRLGAHRRARARSNRLRRAVVPMEHAARALLRQLDASEDPTDDEGEGLGPDERLALALGLLVHWKGRGDALTPACYRRFPQQAFDGVPQAIRDGVLEWPCEVFHLTPDETGLGGLVRSLVPPVEGVGYRVPHVHLLGGGRHAPEAGVYVGWLVPFRDQPALLGLYRPHGHRLEAVESWLRACRELAERAGADFQAPSIGLAELLGILCPEEPR
ncbi:MAG: hypothetical protein ACQEXJ_24695 [Myxococcota bacterium]